MATISQSALVGCCCSFLFPMKKKRPIHENSSVKVEIVETQDDRTGLVLGGQQQQQQIQYETATHAQTTLFKKRKDLSTNLLWTHTHPVVNSFSIHRPDRSISSCGRRASADVSDKRCNTTPPATALKEEEEESHTTLLTWRCPHHTNIFPATILDARI